MTFTAEEIKKLIKREIYGIPYVSSPDRAFLLDISKKILYIIKK